MTRLNYTMHVLLNCKHRLLLNTLRYISLMFMCNLYFNDIKIVECMMRSNSFPSLHTDKYLMDQLRHENILFNEHIISLEEGIESLRDQILTERIENEYTISTLEENQRYLIGKNRALQAELFEIKQTMGQISCDNIELREKLTIQRNYNEILRRNLEISEERNEELSKALLNIAKNKTDYK